MNGRSLPARPALAAITFMTSSLLLTAVLMVIDVHTARSSDQENAVNAAGIFPGFTVSQLPPPEHGVVVTSLRTDSEAEKSGIVVGDEITAIEDEHVRTVEGAEMLLFKDPRNLISFHLLRNHRLVDVSLRRYKEGFHGT